MSLTIRQIKELLENDNFLNNQNYIKGQSLKKVVNRFVLSICRWDFLYVVFPYLWIISVVLSYFVFNYILWYHKYRRHISMSHLYINEYGYIEVILYFLNFIILSFIIISLYPVNKIETNLKLNIYDHKEILLELLRYWKFSRFKIILKSFIFLILPIIFFYFLFWKQGVEIFIWMFFSVFNFFVIMFLPNLFKNFFVKLSYVLPSKWLNKQFVKFFLVTPKYNWNIEKFKIIENLIISDKFVIVIIK
jgi:hypothetical protein